MVRLCLVLLSLSALGCADEQIADRVTFGQIEVGCNIDAGQLLASLPSDAHVWTAEVCVAGDCSPPERLVHHDGILAAGNCTANDRRTLRVKWLGPVLGEEG